MSEKSKIGRPTIYEGEKTIEKVLAYLQECEDTIEEYHKTRGIKSDSYDRLVHVKLPKIEGLAVYLGVSRDTLYQWEKDADKPEFSDIMEHLRATQADRLIDGSLSGFYDRTISKVMLTKHGYTEKQEIDHTTKGEAIQGFNYITPSDSDNPAD